MRPDPAAYLRQVQARSSGVSLATRLGRVTDVLPTVFSASGLQAPVGAVCEVVDDAYGHGLAEVTAIQGPVTRLMPMGSTLGLRAGMKVKMIQARPEVGVGPGMLGRILNGHGHPLDSQGPLAIEGHRSLECAPPDALSRPPITTIAPTGVKALDGLLTFGEGQRLGVMAPAGVGKSTLMGMLARSQGFDVVVVALIGERGREVLEFLEQALGEEGRRRSVVVCATSDTAAMERAHAAKAATTIAEYFRDQGHRVLLMMDSLTRYARALREIGLAAGELPARRGYPASVFADLPKLLERAGTSAHGSITAIYTLLADDETASDPITEEVRGILDGHILLSRKLAAKGHYPAIDVLGSVSRLMSQIADKRHQAAARNLRMLLANYQEFELLIQTGEYRGGQDPVADRAVEAQANISQFLQQRTDEIIDWDDCLQMLSELE